MGHRGLPSEVVLNADCDSAAAAAVVCYAGGLLRHAGTDFAAGLFGALGIDFMVAMLHTTGAQFLSDMMNAAGPATAAGTFKMAGPDFASQLLKSLGVKYNVQVRVVARSQGCNASAQLSAIIVVLRCGRCGVCGHTDISSRLQDVSGGIELMGCCSGTRCVC
jgi:hypothetical protein